MHKRSHSLQRLLATHFVLVAVVPLLLVGGVLLTQLPQMLNRQAEQHSQQLAQTIANQAELFLKAPRTALLGIAEVLHYQQPKSREMEQLLDRNVRDWQLFEAIYVLDREGRVIAVGLPGDQQALRQNYLGLDQSERPFVQRAQQTGAAQWSDTYLSIVSGRMAVSLALPIGNLTLVGNISLDALSDFVQHLRSRGDVLPIIVDRRGDIIGHPSRELSSQQHNILDIALIREALAGKAHSGRFEFQSRQYIGAAQPIPTHDWAVLIGQDAAYAYAELRRAMELFGMVLAAALIAALVIGFNRARQLAQPVERFAEQANALASGHFGRRLEGGPSREFQVLSHSFNRMAEAIQEREQRIARREAQYRQLVEGSGNLITRVDADGHFTYVNEVASQIFGLPTEQLIGRSAFDFIHPDDRQPTREAFEQWLAGNAERMSHENRQVGFDGRVYHMLWSVSADRDANGKLLGFSSIARDISDRKHSEQLLIERQETARRNAEEEATLVDISRLSLESGSQAEFLQQALQRLLQLIAEDGPSPAGAIVLNQDQTGAQRVQASLGLNARQASELAAAINNEQDVLLASARSLPISAGDRTLGQLLLLTADGGEWQTQLSFLMRFSGILGLGILRRQAEAETEYLAYYDSLTGLANRRLLLNRLEQELAATRRQQRFSALLYLDLDNFKTINDSLGHAAGDTLLQQVAERLRHRARAEDTVARLGGDEFVLLLSRFCEKVEDASHIARRLADEVCRLLAEPYDVDGAPHRLSASIGIVIFPIDESSAGDVLRHADTAMYGAKNAGRNTVRFYQRSMQASADARLQLAQELRIALEQKQFLLHYHPKVGADGRVSGAEALIRWMHPERGMVPPDDFIPVAEENGLIVEIGDWVMAEACRQLRTWSAEHAGDCVARLAINVSPWQFRQPDFVERVRKTFADSQVDPTRVTFEITENLLVSDLEDVQRKIQQLGELGVAFAIDDFGTGYSSLAYLRTLPLNELKIDRSFVRDLLVDPNDAAIVDTILAMASRLMLEVTAEGVENLAQQHYLQQRGCQHFQGYLFARPLPADEFIEFCNASRDGDPYQNNAG